MLIVEFLEKLFGSKGRAKQDLQEILKGYPVEDPLDMDRLRRFYDPHPNRPGFGAIMPMPVLVKQSIDLLDGKVMSLAEAVGQIESVDISVGNIKVKVVSKYRHISLEFKESDYLVHNWRLIRYGNVE